VFVFKAALDAGLWGPAVIGLVGSVVAAFYYLRLIKVMWFDGSTGATDKPPFEAKAIAIVTALFAFPVVILALGWLDPLAERAAHAFGLA
jgi:NADH-quinone oxidoreductase subunit N